MCSLPMRAASIAVLLAASLFPQNRLQHQDGTNEAASRGFAPLGAKTVIQRIPEDQAAGRTAIGSITITLQDQAIATPEPFMIEIRGNDPAGPPAGSPNMAPAGLLFVAGPFVPVFPGAGPVAAMLFTVAFAPPIVLPPIVGTPAGDVYVCVALPPAPAWPADGLSVQTSGLFFGAAGEQMRATGVGYGGAAGLAGLAWNYDPAFAVLAPSVGNPAWDIAARFVDPVCQPFATNAAVFTGVGGTGLNPNFGYAGIWPDGARGDGFGWRVRATAPPGSLVYLIVSPARMPPFAVPPIAGFLHVSLFAPFLVFGPILTVPAPVGEPLTTSQAMIGPFPAPVGLGGVDIYAQAVVLDVATLTASVTTMCRSNF